MDLGVHVTKSDLCRNGWRGPCNLGWINLADTERMDLKMKVLAGIVFLLVATTVWAQGPSEGDDPKVVESFVPPESVSVGSASGATRPDKVTPEIGPQPVIEGVRPFARHGDWIADGEPEPTFPAGLVKVPHRNDGRWMWHVERVRSCAWCGEPMTWKEAAFDKKATSLWAIRTALFVTDIEITHHSPCFIAHTCVEANPLAGQTRAQAYAVAFAMTAFAWWGTAYVRMGSKSEHIGGYKYWYAVPMLGQFVSVVGITANLARWNQK